MKAINMTWSKALCTYAALGGVEMYTIKQIIKKWVIYIRAKLMIKKCKCFQSQSLGIFLCLNLKLSVCLLINLHLSFYTFTPWSTHLNNINVFSCVSIFIFPSVFLFTSVNLSLYNHIYPYLTISLYLHCISG